MAWLNYFDLVHWVGWLGYIGLFIIVFSEMGLFFAFILPGDSLALSAGILAKQGHFDIWMVSSVLMLGAYLGYLFGYWFGQRLGHWLMKREDGMFFKKEYVTRSHKFFERHGGKALMLGRLVPIVRTFVSIVAGMGEMNYKRFLLYNFLGAVLWGGGLTLLGYFLGTLVPNISRIFLPIVIVVLLISLVPGIIKYWKERKK